jgi:hypothetical protein
MIGADGYLGSPLTKRKIERPSLEMKIDLNVIDHLGLKM